MSFLQFLREQTFWCLDVFKGRPVKEHYSDIKNIIENPTEEKNKKELYLHNIFRHAVETTNFYKKYRTYNSILDFPVINKNLIRDNFDEFCSSSFKGPDCVTVSTSGSTGTPFSVLQNVDKRHRNTADTIYFSKRSGYRIGQKLIYVKIWPDGIKSGFSSKMTLKNIYPQSVFKLSNKDIDVLIKRLKSSSEKKSFLGYSSAFEKICRYLDEIQSGPIYCNVISIIAISESLNTYTRAKMKDYFGIMPVSRYSNNENGIIAQQDRTDNTKFIINEASYYLEVLDINKDIPNENGKLGRIVITDLHNYAMPLIRYDTGDVGVVKLNEDKTPYLESIDGRKLDLIYDTKGNLVPSHISYKLCKYGDYEQFQLVQIGEKDYVIKLNTKNKVDEVKMLEEYRSYFGVDANITINYVNEIPLLSSGKRREVLNTYHSQL